MMQSVSELLDGSGVGRMWGLGPGCIVVDLAPTGVAVARELVERFGDAIRVTVGMRSFPPDGTTIPDAAPPAASAQFPGLELHLVLDRDVVRSGEDVPGTVHLCNAGVDVVAFDSDSMSVGHLLEAGGARMMGAFSGGIAGMGFMVELPPGEQAELQVIVGTGSCVGEHLYLLPPGLYDAMAVIPVLGSGRVGVLLSDRAPVSLR